MDEQSIFSEALDRSNPEDRAAWLDEACGGDESLKQRLLELLQQHEKAQSFLEQPAADLDATFVTGGDSEDLAASLEAGLAPAFAEDAAVVLGDANHSVLKMLGKVLNEVPRISLRESQAEGDDPISRPGSPEIPQHDSDHRYQLQGEIARGGMGAIIKGRDTDLGRDLAIKVLLDSHKDNPEVIQRFVEEAQIGGQLQHPGIAPIYELGQFSDNRPFFAMKLVKGQTLSKLVADREGAAEERGDLLGIFEQICQTMAYAHSHGVIHRDLKPANIMVGAFGEVQVMDWGLAKVLSVGGVADEKKAHNQHLGQSIIQTLRSGVDSDSPPAFGSVGSETRMGSVMGTPAYMPPEQALGEVDRLDERSDVFGLGAILCEILTGKPPYVGSDGTHVFRQACRGELEACFARLDACGVERELIDLAKSMLAVEPEDRPRNGEAVADEVTGYLKGVQERLRQAELAEAEAKAQTEELKRRRKLHFALAGLSLLIAVFAGTSAVVYRQQREVQTELANRNDTLAKENAEKRNDAELAQQRIALEKKNVEEQRNLAVQNEAAAIALQKTLRRELYIADMQQIRQSYLEGASSRVDGLLRKYVPLDDETDLRGWEWYYWWQVSQLHVQQFGGSHPFKGLAIAPDRTWIAVRRWSNEVIILDAQTMETVTAFAAGDVDHQGTEFAIAPDGGVFACISNTSVRLWNTEDWSELPSLLHDRGLRAITFSPAGLLAAADRQGRVTFWDVQQNSTIGPPLETNHALHCMAFSPHGNRLATSHPAASQRESASLVVWDVTTRRQQTQLVDKSHPVTALAWSTRGDSSLIAAGFDDGNIRIWEGTDYGERDWLVAGAPVRALAFSADGEKLVAGTAKNNSVVVWETESARRVSQIRGHFRAVRGVGFAGDDQTVWSCSEDGDLKSWTISQSGPFTRPRSDIPTSDILHPDLGAITDQEPEDHAVFSDNGRFLAVYKTCGDAENRLQAWRTAAAGPILVSDHALPGDPLAEPPRTMLVSDDGSVVAWSRDRILVLFDLSTGKQTSGSFDHRVAHLALSHDGQLIAEHDNWSARAWDVSSGAPERRIDLEGYPAFRLKFSPDGKFLAMALLNNDLQLHDAVTGRLLHRFQGHAGAVTTIDFSPDSALLASGGDDGIVRLWDVAHRSLLVTFPSHDQSISMVAFSFDGQTILSASNDGERRLWKGGTGSGMQDVRYWVWLARLHAERKSWDAAVADWTKVIGLAPKKTEYYLARGEAYIATEQWELAGADWERVIEQQPDLLDKAFDVFRKAEQWPTAAEFGRRLVEQKPGDSMSWIKTAPVIALSGDEESYVSFCKSILKQSFTDHRAAERAIKVCLLRAGTVNTTELPGETLATALDQEIASAGFLPWGWATRALLAYRSGDAESAATFVEKSQSLSPVDFTKVMNLAILAMAHYELDQSDEAKTVLSEASQLIISLNDDPGNKSHHDLLIAEILFREAEALINGRNDSARSW